MPDYRNDRQDFVDGDQNASNNRTSSYSSRDGLRPATPDFAAQRFETSDSSVRNSRTYNPTERNAERADQRTDPRVDQRTDPRVDQRTDPRADQRTDPRVEQRTDPRTDPRADQRTDPRVDPRTDPRVRARNSEMRDSSMRGSGSYVPSERNPQTTASPMRGARTADMRGARTADMRGARTADMRGARTADAVGARTADAVGARTADAVGARTADMTPQARNSRMADPPAANSRMTNTATGGPRMTVPSAHNSRQRERDAYYSKVSDQNTYNSRARDQEAYSPRMREQDSRNVRLPEHTQHTQYNYRGLDAVSGYAYRSIGGVAAPSRPHVLKTVLPILIVIAAVGALIFGGIKLFELLNQGSAMLEHGQTVSVSIPEGSTTSQIAGILRRAGLISDELAFKIAVLNREADTLLQPGRYTLVGGTNLEDLITTLINGLDPVFDGFTLTIPEGLTIEQTAARVELVCGIPAESFIALAYSAKQYEVDYPFLEDVYKNSMEGFLYPKTYLIPKDATADTVIRILLNQFVIEVVNKVDMTYAYSRNLTFFDVITTASLIEKETAAASERALVSSVIYNRLRYGWLLQIDATVVYALGSNYDGGVVLTVYTEIDSPYNTYKVPQLPAGPICSPQVASIEAAAHPADTDYFYYVLTSKEGFHTFCATDAEFEAAKAEYRRVFGY